MVRMVNLCDQVLMFSLKTLREERSISENGNKLCLRCIKLYMTLSFDFIRVESDANFEVRSIMSTVIANKHRNIMYIVEPDLCCFAFFSNFYLPVTKGVHKKFSLLKPEVSCCLEI